MASIYRKGKRIYLSWYKDGKHFQVSLGLSADSKADWEKARMVKLQKEVELARPNTDIVRRLKFSEAYYLYIKEKQIDNAEVYDAVKKHFLEINGDLFIDKITLADCKKLEKLDISKATVATYLIHLRVLFNFWKKKKWVHDQIVPPIRRTIMPVTSIPSNHFKKIYKNLTLKHQRDFVHFLALTGFRVSEALSFRMGDIKGNRILVHNTKGNRVDSFPLYPKLDNFLARLKDQERIAEYKSRQSLVFWRRACKRLGYNYSLHDIRRTFATHYAMILPPFKLKKLMRHTTIRTTEKYYVDAEAIDLMKDMQ